MSFVLAASDTEISNGALAFLGAMWLLIAIVIIAMIAFYVFVFWRIFEKAGFSGPLGLLVFVPFGELICLLILAFGEWPSQRKI
jgi:hypothetical protein